MRLSLISESIDKYDFYDFYVLLYAYHEHLPNHDEITKHLKYLAKGILSDHLDQIGNIICNRYSPINNHHEYNTIFDKYNIKSGLEYGSTSGFKDLSIKSKQSYLRELLQIINPKDLDDFTGETWTKLAKWYAYLKMPTDLGGMVLLIDNIHNTFHHNGLIIDYMDEFRWLEQALYIRNSGSPAQLLRYASSTVRQLVGRSTFIGQNRGVVADLAKLRVAFNKIKRDVDVEFDGDVLIVSGTFYELSYYSDGWRPIFIFVEIPGIHKRSIDKGILKISNSGEFVVRISEYPDKLLIDFMNQSEIVDVPKPIELITNLATDIVSSGAYAAAGRRNLKGAWIGSIKDNYMVRKY